MTEQWRPVVGYETLYEVSAQGKVRSLGRVDSLGRRIAPAILRGSPDGEGYRNVSLTAASEPGRPGRTTTHRVHVLVLTAFVGPRPAGLEACHGDDVPDNCALANLRWDAAEGNFEDQFRNKSGRTGVGRRLGAPRAPRVQGTGHCGRQHRLIAPNLTAPQGAEQRQRCLACARAHNTVNDAQRLKGITLDINIEADRKYAEIMNDHQDNDEQDPRHTTTTSNKNTPQDPHPSPINHHTYASCDLEGWSA
jgi:hypothetical protein